MNWAEKLFQYYSFLQPPENLPNGIEWLYPQKDEEVLHVVQEFLQKFYNDGEKRRLVLGINPGRFGAGVTGVNFTAPLQLTKYCKIRHPFKNQSELSAEFIYTVINAYGGVAKFYNQFFIGSVCPLGFVQNGKNLNYYDDKALLATVTPFIINSIAQLASFNIDKTNCICIGGEKNYRFLSALNEKYNWFDQLTPLPHPRFIMQYQRKFKDDYLQAYLDAFQ